MGLRFKHEDFAAAWKITCPDKEQRPDLHGADMVKIQPLPFGTSEEQLSQWAQTYKWKIQPIRQIGANSAPVLASSLPPKPESMRSPIVAGDVKLSSASTTGHSSAGAPHDPWAQYLAAQGRPIPSTAASRSVAGPTETEFQEQEGKIHALEARLASIETTTNAFQVETQKSMTQLDTGIKQQAHDTQNRLHSISMRFDEHQKEVALQLQQTSQALEASLVKTMRHENLAIHSTLAALQDMFQENLGRKKAKESAE